MYEYFVKGGVVMYPILICSIVSLAVFLERLWALRRSKVIPEELLFEVFDLLNKGKVQEAQRLCRTSESSLAQILYAGLSNLGKGRLTVREKIEEVGRREVSFLERYLNVISTIASIATLLGLLGTVTGMIKTFKVLAAKGIAEPGDVAGGISEALITTAAGLIVAIPSLVMYNYLRSKVRSLTLELEEVALKLLDFLGKD
jgi:biopolymer transport protein ExbB